MGLFPRNLMWKEYLFLLIDFKTKPF